MKKIVTCSIISLAFLACNNANENERTGNEDSTDAMESPEYRSADTTQGMDNKMNTSDTLNRMDTGMNAPRP